MWCLSHPDYSARQSLLREQAHNTSRDHQEEGGPWKEEKRVAGHRALSNNIKAASEPSEERLKSQ